jgi:hypothetical protein
MASKGFLQKWQGWLQQFKGETRDVIQRGFQALEREMSRPEVDTLIGELEKQAEKAADNIAEQLKELIARLKSKYGGRGEP